MMKLRMRKGMAMLVALCMLITMIPMNVFATFAPADIIGHWAQPEIQSWINQGLIKGYPEDNTFKPEQSITRAEFMTLVNGAYGYEEMDTIDYTDVPLDSWYYNEVCKAEAAGYLQGNGDGTMTPDDPITREGAAKIISIVEGLTSNADVSKYSDAAFISDWAEGYVGAVTAAGIVQGYPDGTFMPKGEITRAESVVGLDNALKYELDAAAAKTVADAITALPADITLANKDAVVAARTAFTALTATQQALVTNVATLAAAETTIADLVAADATNVAAAKTVTDQIALLPSTLVLADATVVTAARTAFDLLTADQKTLVTNVSALTAAETTMAELVVEDAANVAVTAYEVAPLVNADNVIAAEALGETANEAVNAVTNTDAKTGFESRVATEAELVAAARTTEETKAVALINNSTVFNILARLQAPILNLQGIDVAYAAEYQAARVANFTTTKAEIQSNVIDFVKAATDAILKLYIDPLNLAVSHYVGAINDGAQNTAIDDMGDALVTFAGHFALTGYDDSNDAKYMAAFVSAGTLSTLEQVQDVITQVNDEVQLAADVTAAQDAVVALSTPVTEQQDAIDAALLLVNALDNAAAEKAGLLVDIQDAQDLLDATNLEIDVTAAQDAVVALSTPVTEQQDAIDAALVLVNGLDNAVTEKAGLLDDIQNAQIALNIVTAQDAVEALSTPVTEQQDAIDAALVLVNGLDNAVTEKAGLLVAIEDAQVALDEANLVLAQVAVTALETLVTEQQDAIDAALVLVNVLDDAVAEKAGLLADVQDAQDLLDEANLVLAQNAVTALETLVTEQQDAIDAALVLVNVLDNAVTEKAGLLVDVQDAQDLLDAATELALLTPVNDASEAQTQAALDALNYAPYINLGATKRAEVAATFYATNSAVVFEDTDGVKLALDSSISAYQTLLANVNGATTILGMQSALQAIVDATSGAATFAGTITNIVAADLATAEALLGVLDPESPLMNLAEIDAALI